MRHLPALLACSLALTAAPALAANRTFPVGGFDKLRVEGPYTVQVHTGARPSVNATGPQRRLDRLRVESRGGTLIISTERGTFGGGWSWGEGENVVVNVTVSMLSAATLTGSGDVVVDSIRTPAFETALVGSGNISVGQLETGRLSASVTGSGDMTLAGRAARAETEVRGSGDLKAGGVAVDILAATVTGSGDLTVGPTRQATLNLTGSGDITVGGRPKCAIDKRGSGDVRCGG